MLYSSVEEITKAFIQEGWSKDASFHELTEKEAKEKGLTFAQRGIAKGAKFFVMNVTNNVYNQNGQLLCYGNLKTLRSN